MSDFVRFFKPLASVRLTLTCLGFMMVLVFFGTIAQVQIGTFEAQKEYFNRFFVFGQMFGFRVPIFPGGLTIGGLWLINLVAAFFFHFQFRRQNTGILISHAGLILLLSGQFLTQTFAKESQMPIEVGQTSNFSESTRQMELVFIDGSDPKYDNVTSIPISRLEKGGMLPLSSLPFRVMIKAYYPNARFGMNQNSKSMATQGIGTRVSIEEATPVSSDDDVNNVSAFIEIFDGQKSLGTWLVSSGLGAPQSVNVHGKDYAMAIRPHRTYYPFSLTLKEFHHDIYPGTDIPKNFSSLVHLYEPAKNENRDTLIYMNHPLRYDGKTFYQASFGKNDRLSIFQVVQNPTWLAPYVSCLMVVVGLAIQFLMRLFAFSRKRI